MRKFFKLFFYALFFLPIAGISQEECTVAVVSGKATIDGRPLLWKNRDTSNLDNEVAYFDDGKYSYIGVINAGDRTQVWMGVNSAGFCIMNSESRDLKGDTLDAEGYFMKQALMECATAEDFEQLLLTTNESGRETKANFGVIDATGAALFFETGNHTFTKFDANDPETAPLGFIVRANFAMTGTGKGYGHIRYKRANELFEKFAKEKNLSYQTLLRYIARDLKNDKTDPYPLPFIGQEDRKPKGFIKTYDSINRFRTASCAVFHGILPDENPLLTTMWVILGEPICGVVIPLWIAAGSVPSTFDGEKTSMLNNIIQQIEAKAYPDTSLKKYVNTDVLLNREQKGILPRLFKLEDEVFDKTENELMDWRNQLPAPDFILGFENEITEGVCKKLKKIANDVLQY